MIYAIGNHLWQSTLFAAFACLLALSLRRYRAQTRHWIWLSASLKFLVPFSLLTGLGSLLPVARVEPPARVTAMVEEISQPFAPLPSQNPVRPKDNRLEMALMAIWSVGSGIVLAGWWRRWRPVRRALLAASPLPLEAGIPVRTCRGMLEPGVFGIFRPVLLLPEGIADRLTSSQLKTVLAHELSHVRRRDNLTSAVHMAVETLFWFHPAVWWIGRQMLEERERACDERVLDNGHDGAEYAAGILEVCRHCRAGAFVSAAATSGDLTRRVRYILGNARPRSLGVVKAMALLFATVAITAAPLFAGAVVEGAHRQELFAVNLRALGSAEFSIGPAMSGAASPQRVITAPKEVVIRNSSLRDLIAIAYGVERWRVVGGPEWLDSPRYDLRALSKVPVSDPENLDLLALQAPVTELLASRFGLEIRVNHRCQAPCGKIRVASNARR